MEYCAGTMEGTQGFHAFSEEEDDDKVFFWKVGKKAEEGDDM